MKKMGAKELRALPREYFYLIEHGKYVQPNPKIVLYFTFVALLFDVFAVIFARAVGKPTFALFLAVGFVVIELIVIAILVFLVKKKLCERKLKLYRVTELLGYAMFTYSMVPTVVALFLMRYFPLIFVILAMLLFPLGLFFQWFIVRKMKQGIFEGEHLPEMEGVIFDNPLKKYLPYISIILGILESLRLGSYAKARISNLIWGNIVGDIVLPFLALGIVFVGSILILLPYMQLYFTYLFPDWLPDQKIMAQAQAQAPKQKSDTQQ